MAKGLLPREAVPSIDSILSIPTTAAQLGVSTKTVRRLISSQKLRMIRITEGRVGIRRSELERYIASREVAA